MQRVGVLEFVHQNVAETVAVMLLQVGIVTQQFQRAQQQFREIHHAVALAGLFVHAVNLHHLPLVEIAFVFNVVRARTFVLTRIEETSNLTGREAGFVEFQRFEDALDHTNLVFGIEDLEGLRQFGLLPVQAEQAVRNAVEGANPHTTAGQLQQVLDAFRAFLPPLCW